MANLDILEQHCHSLSIFEYFKHSGVIELLKQAKYHSARVSHLQIFNFPDVLPSRQERIVFVGFISHSSSASACGQHGRCPRPAQLLLQNTPDLIFRKREPDRAGGHQSLQKTG